MSGLLEVPVAPVALARLSTLLPLERVQRVEEYAAAARRLAPVTGLLTELGERFG